MNADDSFWARSLSWVWSNWDDISDRLGRIYKWFRPGPPTPATRPGILIIGPGGTGKTTLARLLSGEYTTRLFEEPWRYEETISEERYTLTDDPGVEVIVPPGQKSRREAAWADVRADITAGKYRGVILQVAYGWHTLPTPGSYRHHPLYTGSKDRFASEYAATCRAEELHILQYLRPALEAASNRVWLLAVVAKQDLWWADRAAVGQHYQEADWRTELDAIQRAKGATFRFEWVFTSLVIANFMDRERAVVKPTAEGYDQERQVESLRRLFEVLDGLREWEGVTR